MSFLVHWYLVLDADIYIFRNLYHVFKQKKAEKNSE